MSDRDLTPERLDGVLDGSVQPVEEADRDMLALAARLRAGTPGASASLRERVGGLDVPAGRGTRRSRWSGWRGRALIAGPALAATLAAVIGFAVFQTGDSGTGGDLAGRDSAGSQAGSPTATTAFESTEGVASRAADTTEGQLQDAAPTLSTPSATAGPFVLTVAPQTTDARLADIRQIVVEAGGTIDESRQTEPAPGILVAITLPAERAQDVLDQIGALGSPPAAIPLDAGVGARFVITETP